MRWPFVSRRRVEAELDAVKADRERIRGERDQFSKDRDASVASAARAVRMYAEADTERARLTDRNKELTDRLNEHGSSLTASDVLVAHDVHRKALADALGEQWHLNWDQLIAVTAVTTAAAVQWMEDHASEKARADGLQARLDDACGLNHPAVDAGQQWQKRREDKPTVAKEPTP